MRGDAGSARRCGEIWGDTGEIRGDMGRCGEGGPPAAAHVSPTSPLYLPYISLCLDHPATGSARRDRAAGSAVARLARGGVGFGLGFGLGLGLGFGFG